VEIGNAIGSTTPLANLTVLGTQTTDLPVALLKATSASFAGLNVSGGAPTVTLDVGTLTIGAGGINKGFNNLAITGGGSIAGPIAGSGATVTKAGTGTLVLNGISTWDGQTTVNAGELRVNGTLPGDLVLTAGLLSGTGSLGGFVNASGAGVSPGSSPGILAIADNLTFNGQSTFTVEMNGATAGTGYDQVTVDGQLTLGNAALVVTAADSLPVGQALTVIDKTSGLDVNGTFAGKPEGTVFDLGAVRLRISYVGGDGNDVTLTRLRQPTSLTLTCGPANAVEGSAVTLTATVSGPSGLPSPTGSVTFKDGSTVLGTAAVSGGVATLTTSSLGAGDHALSADFASDFYDPSSATASQHIDAKPVVTQSPVTESGNPSPVVTIPPPLRGLGIKVDGAKGKEKKGAVVTFVVKLSEASTKAVTVTFATKNGTAKAKKDFKAVRGTLTFKPGQTRLLVKVRIVDDKVKETVEKFTLVMSSPTLARAIATGTIRDND
jgi:autotransporter-associated beta strand protein